MTDVERLKMAILELEKKIKYVDIVLNDKRYLEVAYYKATRKMRERKDEYPKKLAELKKQLAYLER